MISVSKLRMMILGLLLMFFVGTLPVSAENGESETSTETIELSVFQTDLWDYTPLFQTYVDEINPNIKISIYSFPIGEYEDRL